MKEQLQSAIAWMIPEWLVKWACIRALAQLEMEYGAVNREAVTVAAVVDYLDTGRVPRNS